LADAGKLWRIPGDEVFVSLSHTHTHTHTMSSEPLGNDPT